MVLTHRTIHYYQLVNNDKRFCWHLAEISPPHESLKVSSRSTTSALPSRCSQTLPHLNTERNAPPFNCGLLWLRSDFCGSDSGLYLGISPSLFSVKTQNVRKSFSGGLPSTYSMPRIPRVIHVDHFSVCRHTFQKTLVHQTRDGNSHRCLLLLALGQGHRVLLRC